MHQVVVEWIGAFGYWGVFALIAVVTFNDILRLIRGG